ncbi:helix-turn-helix transcriptional regulator [Streptomyces sp. NPDC050095]|uniref:AraC family transcriptional regulator n=1 Tax=unclassified Streptomyces TaxID=2593676 RepID=UPI00342CD680
MVESGQTADTPEIAAVGFQNPDRPRLGLEAARYSLLTSRLSAQMRSQPHRPDFHTLLLVRSGQASVTVDFVEHRCTHGTLLHIRPGQVHRLFHPSACALEADLVLFTAAFPPRLERIAPLLSHLPGPVAWQLTDDEHAGIGRAMDELAPEYRRATREAATAGATVDLLRLLLGALLLRVTRLDQPHSDTPTGSGATGDLFRRFRHELDRSYATTRNAADYASRIGCSLRTLNRACQAATGHTAKALIDAHIALEAKRLLAHTDLPVATISRRLGFSEPTNFGKFFTRETGTAPGAFRTQERG